MHSQSIVKRHNGKRTIPLIPTLSDVSDRLESAFVTPPTLTNALPSCLKDPSTFQDNAISGFMTRDAPPSTNSPANLPMTVEFPTNHPGHILLDTTFVAGNKRPFLEKLSSFNDEATEGAKRHRRSDSSSTIGSTEALWMDENMNPATAPTLAPSKNLSSSN